MSIYDALIESLQIAKASALMEREHRGHARQIERKAEAREMERDLLAAARRQVA